VPEQLARLMDEDAARLTAIVRDTVKQIQELLAEYASRSDATVGGLASLREEALRSLQQLVHLEDRR
jgi:hypothetical protein